MKRHFLEKQVFVILLSLLTLNLFSQTFVEQTGISLPAVSSSSVAWGDYNNDGYLDILLTGSSNSGPISKIYRNNGDNTFTEQTGIVLTGVQWGSAVWGDYDNDGYLDILLTGQSDSGPISKIYRNNGNNTFSEQTDIVLTGVMMSSVAWGDYDNDGKLDILLTGDANSSLVSKIYHNNGDNTFTEQTGISLTGVQWSSVTWGDYNNDGYLDILLTGMDDSGQPISKIYRNNRDNTFTEETSIDLTGVQFSSVSWGDYDNDGNLDILETGQDSSSQIVSKIYRNNGDNTFNEQKGIVLTGVSFGSVSWADYNNDGYLDILLTGHVSETECTSKIYRNNKDNTFTEQSDIVLPSVETSSVDWGDYDRDGNLDILLTGDNPYSSGNILSKIYRNQIINHNVAPSIPNGLQSYWDNDLLILKWNNSVDNTTPKKALGYNLRIGTTQGGNEIKSGQALSNGLLLLPKISNLINDTCIILKLPLNKYYWSVQSVDKGGLSSGFAPEQVTKTDSIQAKDLQAFIKPNNSLLIRWKNGNGLRRVLFGRLSTQEGMAKPEDGIIYHAEPVYGKGDQIGSTGWFCMYNGIADSAVVYGISGGYSYDIQVIEYIEINDLPVYFNTLGNANPGLFSSSLFSEQTSIVLAAVSQGSSAWGDYDNDGYLDILLTGYTGSTAVAKIYHNNGDNTFTEQTSIILPGVQNLGSVAWGDYDNDGYLDILLTGQGPGIISKVFHNNGDNTFTEQTGIVLTGVQFGSAVWGDYDNDGYLDILITGDDSSFQPVLKIYHNNGNNTFTEQTGIVLTGVIWGSAVWGDYDNDGKLDILVTGSTSNGPEYNPVAKIYHNNGNNTFTEQTSISLTGVYYAHCAWADYDNDGYLDILISGATGEIFPNLNPVSKIFRNNGNNTFTEQTNISLTGVYNNCIGWGDYDNDGYLDILLGSKVYHNNGNNSFTEQTDIHLPGVNMNSFAWGDYDNDGDLDLLLGSKVYRNNTFMKAGNYLPNKKPLTPDKLLATPQPGYTKLTWAPVRNDETPYKAMSYNVRIGTAPGKSDILQPHSDTGNGFRRIIEMGNAQLDTTFIIKNLSSGNYYWGVQAVDQGYKGGSWSAESSFEVKNVQVFYSADIVCLGYPTHFTDQSVATDGIASWKWDFKDGSTSSSQNPVHTFGSSGQLNVKLVIISSAGVKDSLEKTIIVKPRPKLDFSASTACQGSETSLVNLTDTTGLKIMSWSWDYGDGKGSTFQNPVSHGFLTAGDYKLTLIAVAGNGCSDTIKKTVTVANYPVALITTNAPLNFCSGDSVTLSVPYNSKYIYRWMVDSIGITSADSNLYVPKISGSFSVGVVNSSGNCKTTSSSVKVTVKPVPFKPVIGYDNYQPGKCPGETPATFKVSDVASGVKYQWYLNHVPMINGASSSITGFFSQGDYTVEADLNDCKVLSDSLKVQFADAPQKPVIYAKGPIIWYLACSNDSASQYKWYFNGTLIPGADKYLYVANQNFGKYNVSISNSKGCFTRSDTITIPIVITGIDDVDAFTGLKIYPNPTPGIFTVEMDNNIFGELDIRIFTSEGREILDIKFEKTTEHFISQIDLSGQGKGIYLVKFLIDKYLVNRKVIVE